MARIIIDIEAHEPHFKSTRIIEASVGLQESMDDSLTTQLLALSLQEILQSKFLPAAVKQVMDRISKLPNVAADAVADAPSQEVTDVRH